MKIRRFMACGALSWLCFTVPSLIAADEILFEENFNDDGEGTRYTSEGRFVSEVADHAAKGVSADQVGPVYWAHSSEVSLVGVPGPTAARRAVITWHHELEPDQVTDDGRKLVEATIAWLTKDKANLRVLFSPAPLGSGDEMLVEMITSKGGTVTGDEDTAGPLPPEADFDLVIHSSQGAQPSRFTNYAVPYLTYNGPDHDDELVGTIGLSVTQAFPDVSVGAPEHPAAGGLAGNIEFFVGEVTVDAPGTEVPDGSTVVASYPVVDIPPVTSLADVAAMVAGDVETVVDEGTIPAADIESGDAGNFSGAGGDNPAPGGPIGSFATVATGSFKVKTAGTYGFALWVAGGARLRIDTDGNGLDAGDTVIEQDQPAIVDGMVEGTTSYGDATFAAAGDFDFEWIAYSPTDIFGAEVYFTFVEGAGQTDPVDDQEKWAPLADWEGNGIDVLPINLNGEIAVTKYEQPAQVIEELPLIVAINGPDEGGQVFGGGAFIDFEGEGFFAGSALNKFAAEVDPKTLTLNPVDLTGQTGLKLKVLLAATTLDFETSDFLDIKIDPTGSGTFQDLIHFTAPSADDKFFSDGTTNLNIAFQEVTADLPDGMTNLVIRIEAVTTWWNEVVAIDHIRVVKEVEGGAAPIDINLAAGPEGLAGFYWNIGPKETPTANEPMHRAGDGPEGADNSNSGWVDENVYTRPATGGFTASSFTYQGNDLTPIKEWLGADADSFTGTESDLDDGVFRMAGYLRVEAPGSRDFTLTSDDGSVLYIDDKLVISNDNGHGNATVTATVEFSQPGYYPVDIRYFNGDWTNAEGDHGGANFLGEAGLTDLVQTVDTIPPFYNHSVAEPVAPGTLPADSVADFGGPDVNNGWQYGYRNVDLANRTDDYDPVADFIEFPDDWWEGDFWNEPNADGDNVPWTEMRADSTHPNGDNNGELHWTIRRWNSPGGAAEITWSISKGNVNCGNGVTGAVHINGVRVDSATIAFDDAVGVTRTITADLQAGDVVDLVNSPFGDDGTDNDGCDGSNMAISFAPAMDAPQLLVNLDASGLPEGALATWTNAGDLGGDFQAFGDPTVEVVDGILGVTLDGDGDYLEGPPSTPAIEGASPRSIIAWVYNPELQSEETVISWGKRGGPDGTNMSFNHGFHNNFGAVGHWGGDGPDIGWNPNFDVEADDPNSLGDAKQGEWTHIAYTQTGSFTKVYTNGQLTNSEDAALDTFAGLGILVGAQREADGVAVTEPLKGSLSIASVRVFAGVISDANILADSEMRPPTVEVQPPTSLDILFLGANDAPDAGADGNVAAFLEANFGPVRYMNSANTDGSETADVIVMSSTFGSGSVRGKFHNSAVPIVNWEEAIMDANTNGEFGQSAVVMTKSTDTTQMALGDHPIAGAFANTTIDFLTAAGAETLGSGEVSAGTDIVGTAVGGAIDGMAMLFVTDAGGAVAEGAGVNDNLSPARRVAFPITDATFDTLTDAGKALLVNSILWAAGGGGDGAFYEQNFDAFADGVTDLGDGSIIASNDGTNSVLNGVLRMTQTGVNGTAASFILPGFDASTGWSAKFDFVVEHAGENTPADGFSFNYGAIPEGENFGNPAEEGYGDITPHVSYQVDTWLWDDAAGQDAGVGIELTGTELVLTKAADDDANFKPNERVSGTAYLSWDPANGASFTTTGLRTNADFSNIATPGFAAEAGYGFSFLARTGGHNETVEIDNLVVGPLGSVGPDPGNELAVGLVAYYPLDGDSNDAVGNSHGVGKQWLPGGKGDNPDGLAAHPVTTLTYAPGKYGNAVDLDGVDQYIETPVENEDIFDFGAPDAPTGFTVSAWFRVDGFTKGWQALIAKGEGAEWRVHRQGENDNFGPVGGATTPNNDIGEDSTSVNDGALHHVALVSDPNGIVGYYLDGVLIDSGDTPPVLDGNIMPMMIGQNPDTDNRTWDGLIDDVALWSRALSADEVSLIANSAVSVGELAGLDVAPPPTAGFDLLDVGFGANGAFQVTIPDGITADIEYSTNLIDWTVIATGLTGTVEETDAGRLAAPSGYYRAK